MEDIFGQWATFLGAGNWPRSVSNDGELAENKCK